MFREISKDVPPLPGAVELLHELIDRLALEDFHYLHAARGELLRRLGRSAEAGAAYRRALALVHDEAERRLLERRLAELPR